MLLLKILIHYLKSLNYLNFILIYLICMTIMLYQVEILIKPNLIIVEIINQIFYFYSFIILVYFYLNNY